MRTLAACSVGLLLAGCLVGGCSGPKAVEKQGLDTGSLDLAGISQKWELALGVRAGETVEKLTLDGPVLLARTSANRLFVVNAELGRFLCYIDIGRLGEPIYGISRYLNRLYIVGLDGFREYDLETGLLVRKTQLSFAPSTGAAREADEIYVGSLEGRLYAMLNSNLARVWSYATTAGITSGPVTLRGLVAIGSSDGWVVALKSRSTVVWQYKCNGRISCDMVSQGGKVFVACEDTKVYCLSTTGQPLWRQFLQAALKQPPVPVGGNGLLYQVSPATGMNVLQIERDGEPAWKAPRKDLTQFVATTPLRTYFVNSDGRLESVGPLTGERVAVLPTPPGAKFATNPDDSGVFLSTVGGTLYSLRDKNGSYIDRSKLFTASAP
jgi:outer membrane protein assembly factor BamB